MPTTLTSYKSSSDPEPFGYRELLQDPIFAKVATAGGTSLPEVIDLCEKTARSIRQARTSHAG